MKNANIKKIKDDVTILKKDQEKIVSILEKSVDIQKSTIGALEISATTWKEFLGIYWKTVLIIFIIIYRNELMLLTLWLIQRIIIFWQRLSENWQITVVSLLGTALIAFLSIYFDRRFFRKSSDSIQDKQSIKNGLTSSP